MEYELLSPNTPFTHGDKPMDISLGDFWAFLYSNLWDLQSDFAEYIVSKALNISKPSNKDGWCLWDISYKNKRIEVKATSDWHSWNIPGYVQKSHTFTINKAYTEYKNPASEYKRQSDLYVFCHLTGHDKVSSNPMNLDNWEFYVVPTSTINKVSGDAKRISLSVVKKIARKTTYDGLRLAIDDFVV